MKRLLLLLPLLLLLLPSQAKAQVFIQNDVLLNQNGQPVPLATVTVCIFGSTGSPCTALAPTVYTDVTGTTPLNQTLTPIQTDGQGNYQFFVGPGNYTVTFSRPGYSGKVINFSFPCVPNTPVLSCGSSGGTPGIGPAGTIQTTNGSGILAGSGEVDNGFTLTINRDVQSKGPNPWFDIMRFGGYASPSTPVTTTGTITGGNNALTVASASTFAVGQGIEINGAGPATTLATPNTPTVTPANILGGATTYNYQIVAEDFNNGLTAASAVGNTTTGRTSLGVVSQSITTATRVAGITTYTTSAIHNIQVGASIEITGFPNGTNLNGDFTVATVPTGTTFTVYQPTAGGNVTQSASASVAAIACNTIGWNSQTSGNLTTAMRYLIYRNGALVATSVGIDPYFLDCGFTATNLPAYYPTTPSVTAQAGNFSSTIATIVGNLITLTNNVTTSVSGARVQHDNWPSLQAAYQAAIAESGGTVYIPTEQPSGGFFVFNSPINLASIANVGVTVGITQAGRVVFNQPLITASGLTWVGVPKTDLSAVSSVNPLNEIDGVANPLIYMPGGQGNISFKGTYLNCNNTLQSCVTIDTDTSGFGDTGVLFENFFFGGQYSSEAKLIQRGGFGLEFNRGRCSQNNAVFGTGPCIRQTAASAGVGTGMTIAGNLVMRYVNFGGAGYQVDEIPGPASINNQTWMAEDIFSGNLSTPLFNVGWPTQAFSINNVTGFGSKGGTALLDITLSVVGPFVGPTFNGARTALSNFNYNANPFFAGPPSTSTQTSLANNDRTFFAQPAPTNFTTVAGAGGSVPATQQLYGLSVTDIEGNESPILGTSSITVTGGNQTITLACTAPTEATNLQFYNFYRFDTSVTTYKQVVGGFHQSTCNATDSSATFGAAATNQIGAAETALDANGLTTWKLRFGQLTISAPGVTSPSGWTFPNNAGSVFAGTTIPQTFTANQTIANGNELHFISTDLSHFAGFKGGASTTNLVWLFPTTDSTGTQCLSSNGSLQLAWSNCSGGTGTPGGSTTQVQYNNAGSFGGSANLTWVSPKLTVGLNTGVTGQIGFAGLTSGNVTVQSQDVAGTWTFKWPTTGGTANFPLITDGSGNASWTQLPVAGGGTGAGTFTANQLLTGNGLSAISSLAGSTTGTSPILKLQPSSAANTALTVDTAATPTGDILDVNINGTKTSWFDSAAGLHTPIVTYTSAGPLTLSGTEGTCSGAAVGNDVLCLGDTTSHTPQVALNGGGFKSLVDWFNVNPPAHAVMLVGATFPQANFTATAGSAGQALVSGGSAADPSFGTLGVVGGGTGSGTLTTHGVLLGEGTGAIVASAAGTSGQPFLSGGAGADGAYGALSLASSAVSGTLPVANGGTGSTTLSGAGIATITGAITPNNCVKWSSSTVITDAGAPCGGSGAAARLDQITGATANNTFTSTTFAQIWNWAPTGSLVGMQFGEGAAGTGSGNTILRATTLATSTSAPFQADANGIGWKINSAGLFLPVSTGSAALPGTTHGVVLSEGSSTAIATTATGNVGQVLISNGSGADPTFQDPIVSFAFVNIWTAQDVTATRTSSIVRNPIFSQTGTLQLTWAGITGSPATCTLQIQGVDSQGNVLNNGSTVSVTPANGTTSQTFTAAASLQTAAQIRAIFACGTYPTAGTLTLDFTPIPNVNVTNTVAISGTVTTTPPSNASTNVAQFGGNAVVTGTGASGTGIPRVTISNDSSLAANQSVNENQIGGVAAAVDANGRQIVKVYPDTTTTSYHASANVASAASATDIAVLPGNATNTVLVYRVQITCTQTAAGIITLQLIKRSTADTAGTSSNMTVVPDDSNYAAGVSVPKTYTANPTTGTAVGNVDTALVGCMAPGTTSPNDIYIFSPAKPIVLRGIAQQLAINLNGVTVTGGSFDVTYDYAETTTP